MSGAIAYFLGYLVIVKQTGYFSVTTFLLLMTVTISSILFWVLLFAICYTYFGYGLMIWLLLKLRDSLKSKPAANSGIQPLPSVAFIIPAYNEEDTIAGKIENTLALQYPPERLKIMVVSDGSTDRTAEIVKTYSNIILLDGVARNGKAAAMNRAVAHSGDVEILVFSDANTTLNPEALVRMMAKYSDPKVGGVSGEKKVRSMKGAEGGGESAYWKYESALKKLDSRLYSVAGAAGELLSVRKNLYEPLEDYIILDDFVLSFRICMKGFMVKYVPDAVATENPSLDLGEEEKRKVRISAGAFQAMQILLPLLNIFKYGVVSFQYISRRLFRWLVCPFALPSVFLLNIILVVQLAEPLMLYKILLCLQVAFYLMSVMGGILAKDGRRSGLFYIAFYFVFMNFSVFSGLRRYLKGSQSASWEKSARAGGNNHLSSSKNT